MIEYRIGWAASSNASFHGYGDWHEWDEPDVSGDVVEDALCHGGGGLTPGLEEALEASGFEWWVETRVTEDANAS